MSRIAVIVAGGSGKRAGGTGPKQFEIVAGKPLIFHTMERFLSFDKEMKIIVVLNKDYIPEYINLCHDYELPIRHSFCIGGDTRCDSVISGLQNAILNTVSSCEDIVAIHDAARPVIDDDLLRRGFESVKRGQGAVPVVESVNSLRHIVSGNAGDLRDAKSESVIRKEYVEVQTPQIFYLNDIFDAYRKIKEKEGFEKFTDDASVAEACGMGINLYAGDRNNIKVTYPIDFKIAEILLSSIKKGRKDRRK